jgi:hypothetical protein
LQTTNIGDVLFIETHRGQVGIASGQGGKPKKTASGSLVLNRF